MSQYNPPILTSILDTDAYKLHMQQAVYHHYKQVTVAAEFLCRNDDDLGQYAEEINYQISMMSELALNEEEYLYLAGIPFFRTDYLDWLRQFRYQPQQVKVTNKQGKLAIRISGSWLDVILWEVPLLAVISEIVHRDRSPNVTCQTAIERLQYKLHQFTKLSASMDMSGFKLMDFGTRRRFSAKVHHTVVSTLKEEFPYLIGTSNYNLARYLNLNSVGTQAHEWFQAHQQISAKLKDSQKAALQVWLDEYPTELGIALTDCISMDAFLQDFDYALANRYAGLRHDSGDPVEWGEKAIKHYQNLGIDPKTKTLVFSDNLSLEKALHLYQHFYQRIPLIFGIGTQLTCDIPHIKPLNIVIKLIECNGRPVAKLSDSPGKIICQDQEFIRALRKAFSLPDVKKAS